jgi:hypothetical protein
MNAPVLCSPAVKLLFTHVQLEETAVRLRRNGDFRLMNQGEANG